MEPTDAGTLPLFGVDFAQGSSEDPFGFDAVNIAMSNEAIPRPPMIVEDFVMRSLVCSPSRTPATPSRPMLTNAKIKITKKILRTPVTDEFMLSISSHGEIAS